MRIELSSGTDADSVLFSAANVVSAAGGRLGGERIQACWEFAHPHDQLVLQANGQPLTNVHNARSAHPSFHIPHACVLHGFAGYFDALLYGDVEITIVREPISSK